MQKSRLHDVPFFAGLKKGDLAFIYHSSTDVVGIAGIMKVVSTAYPDPTQFE